MLSLFTSSYFSRSFSLFATAVNGCVCIDNISVLKSLSMLIEPRYLNWLTHHRILSSLKVLLYCASGVWRFLINLHFKCGRCFSPWPSQDDERFSSMSSVKRGFMRLQPPMLTAPWFSLSMSVMLRSVMKILKSSGERWQPLFYGELEQYYTANLESYASPS